MTVYRRLDGLVTCGLTAYKPGLAPGPTLGNDYGRTLPFLPRYAKRGICRRRVSVCVCVSHSGIVSKLLNI